MTDRKFYRTVFEIEVLSEKPIDQEDVLDSMFQISEGNSAGVTTVTVNEELDGKKAADALLKQERDPDFFCLDADGNDIS